MPGRQRRRSIPATVAAFAAVGLVAVAVVAVVAAFAVRQITDREALDEARQLTRATAFSAVEPDLTDGLLTGDPRAVGRLDRAVRTRVLRSPVKRVKLWTLDGRIVYSDATPLIGRRFALGAEELDAARRGRVQADVSDARRPENVFERDRGKLLEVYLPVRTPLGRPLLWEEYLSYAAVTHSGRRQWLALLPAFGGALLVLALAQLPLAWWLARRLEQREQEREGLLVRLVESSDRERRRLAQALHEGPVQVLAGLAWRLSAAARRAPPALGGEFAAGAADARGVVGELRSLLVTLHPPNLGRVGLYAALADLVAPLRAAGIDVELDIDAEGLGPDAEALVYRAAEEALRNAQRHARPQRVAVRVRRDGAVVRLSVRDDGCGFVPRTLVGSESGEQRGLALLADLAADAGGRLDIDAALGAGTRLELELPLK